MNLRDLTLPLLGLGVLTAALTAERVTSIRPEPGPVEIVYWEKWTGAEGEGIQSVVDAFNKKQNRIRVRLLTVSAMQNKVMLAVAGGTPPDVAGLWGNNVAQYADANAIQPLDDLCREAGIKEEQYLPAYWDIGFYRGRIYALPSTPASTALHFNRDLFAKAGLDPKKPPRTIEELDAASEKLTTRAGGRIAVAGFMHAEPGWWNWSWGAFFGGRLWDGKTKITANAPENVRAFEWLASYSKKYGGTELQTFKSGFGNFSSPQNAFLSQKVAMVMQGVWMHNYVSQYAPKLNWAAAPFPYPADRPDLERTTIAEEDVLMIPRGAKHPREAFEFIKFVQSQEGMEMLCLAHRKNSPLVAVSENFWRKHGNPYIRLFHELAGSKNAVSPPKMGIWPEYGAELNNAFDEILLLRKTPKEALDDVQARMQPKFDGYLKILRLRQEQEAREEGKREKGKGKREERAGPIQNPKSKIQNQLAGGAQ